jgi:hypothetical protein
VGLTEELGGLSYNRTVNGISNSGGIDLLLGWLNMRKFDYFVPFAEFLLGGAHAGPPMTGNTSQTAFALAAGGGVDIVLSKNIAWRFAEIDYLMTNFSGASLGGNSRQDNLRLGTGIVLRFGLPKEAPPPPVNRPPVAACSANPTSVFAGSGDTVAIHVNATDPDNEPLTYTYTAASGTVDGTGPDARWNSTGLSEGTYTVTTQVSDGKGGTASCATDITVEARPNRPPTASLAVERSPILPGEHTGITCTGNDPDNDPLAYTYSASGGQVTGTGSSAQFDATGLQPGTYNVKCTVNDGRGGTADASGNVQVNEPPQVHQLELKLALHSIYFRPAHGCETQWRVAREPGRHAGRWRAFKQYLTYKADAHDWPRRRTRRQTVQPTLRAPRERQNYLTKKALADHIDTKAYVDQT